MTKKDDNKKYEFGLNSFGDIALDDNGKRLSDAESIRQVVKEAVLADKLGIDVIGLGEHHREDFAISSPETVLAAIASVTKRIKLSSAVTVLSSDDPVRVYQRFATLDAVSSGRAQIILGRGSFTESYPLFDIICVTTTNYLKRKLSCFRNFAPKIPLPGMALCVHRLRMRMCIQKPNLVSCLHT